MSDIIIEQLRALRLTAFADALEHQRQQPGTFAELSFEERLTLLLEQELLIRENNKITRLRKKASFRIFAHPEKIDYSVERGLKKSNCAELFSSHYLKKHQNIIITGATGCGKTYFTCALGEQAVREQYTVQYYRVGRLLNALASARVDGSYSQVMNKLSKVSLLILDDWGLEKLTEKQSSDLLEVMEDRYQLSSTIIASQVPISEWHELILNPTIADSLLDRLVHNGHKIDLKGDSLRKQDLT